MEERKHINQPMIDCIKACLHGLKFIQNNHQPYEYLLGQAIREYAIPNENWHITKAAAQTWNRLTSNDINKFFFNEPLTCDKIIGNEEHTIFKGANKKGVNIIVNNKSVLRFNNVFICEHTTPVKMIQEQLLALDDFSDEKIINIMETIHITRMLKEEDHRIKEKFRREGTFEEIVNNVYCTKGIILE